MSTLWHIIGRYLDPYIKKTTAKNDKYNAVGTEPTSKVLYFELLGIGGDTMGWDKHDETRGNGRRERVDLSRGGVETTGTIGVVNRDYSFLRVLRVDHYADTSVRACSPLKKGADARVH